MTQEQIKIASEWLSKFNKFVSENYPAFVGEFDKKIIASPSVSNPLKLHIAFQEELIINDVIRNQMARVFEEYRKSNPV